MKVRVLIEAEIEVSDNWSFEEDALGLPYGFKNQWNVKYFPVIALEAHSDVDTIIGMDGPNLIATDADYRKVDAEVISYKTEMSEKK
jgi:hypothetical protein